jgi:hypothetical protein
MKATRVVFVAAMALGLMWNCLCLVGVFPFGLWRLSFSIVAFGTICILLPRVLRGEERPTAGQRGASLAVAWYAAWVITVIACLVYPL